MASDLVTLGAAFVSGALGAGAAIGAGAVTQRGERKRATQQHARQVLDDWAQWERNERATLYTRVMVAHGRALLSLHALRSADPTAPEAGAVADRAEQAAAETMDVLMALQVLGSKQVHDLADKVGQEIVRGTSIDQAELEPKWSALAAAMRGELGLID